MDPDGEQTNAETSEPATPLYFGNYEVLKSIGRGKFAIVYRAKKIGSDQVVALKRIAVDMMNEKARDKCLKEVRLLQSLDHPNIIHYMDSFITENDLVIVYEWAAAGDLKRQLRKAQERGTGFEERVIWKYFSQICNAIKHMHDKRIMHRDLKPANIFLTLDGTIKVGDLGLSRELSEHTIQAHSKVGTPLYMSPEVLKNEGYDFKSDIWSLGCLLYELAMLKSPFKSEGLNLLSLFQKISNGDYQPLPDTYSEELRNLTYAMISTLPEDRPEINEVCERALQMRTLTAEKAKSLRKSSNSGIAGSGAATQDFTKTGTLLVDQPAESKGAEGDSRPNSGRSVTNNTNNKNNADHKADYVTEPPTSSQRSNRTGSAGTGPTVLPLQREGSFKLEQVNEETGATDSAKRSSGGGRGNPYASGANTTANQKGASGDRGRDSRRDYKDPGDPGNLGDEEEDEVTVGLGQADYLDAQLRGAGNNGGNRKYNSNNNSSANAYLNNDITSASTEFTPGVIALGSDNKPTYRGSNTDTQMQRGYDASSSKNKDRNNVNDNNYNKSSAAERKFDPSDFVSSEQPSSNSNNNNTTTKYSPNNNGSNNNASGVNGNSAATGVGYRRAKPDAPVSNQNNNNNNSSSNNNVTSPPSANKNKAGNTSTAVGKSNKGGNSIPRPSGSSNNTNNYSNKNTNYNNDDDVDVNEVGSRPGSVNAVYSNTRANSREGTFRGGAAANAPEYTVQGRTLEQHLADSAPAFAVMDTVYTKLQLLRYPMDDPYIKSEYKSNNSCRGRLLPFHFACDLQIYPTVAGHSPGYQFMQFKRAIHVASWLCCNTIMGSSAVIVNKMDVHQDTPIMCAKQLLRAAQAAASDNILPAELAETTPTQLMCGFGLPICNLLMHLCDAALSAQGYAPRQLVFAADTYGGNDGGDGDNGNDDADELEDEAGLHSEDDTDLQHGAHLQISMSAEDSSTNHNAHAKIVSNSMLLGQIDPLLWKQETERVASKLIAARSRAGEGREWADHIDSLRTYSSYSHFTATATSANVSSGGLATANSRKASVHTEALAEELSRTRAEIERTLNKITQMESVLNRQSNVSSCAIQYAAFKNELLERGSKVAAIQQNIAQFAHKAAELQERCDEINETLTLKTGGDGSGSGSGGGNTIVRLKDGLKTIKSDIKEMSMSIVLLNNNLMELRKEGIQRGRNKYQRKQRAKRGDSISVLSDDDAFID